MVEATASDFRDRARKAFADRPISELRGLQIEQSKRVLVIRGVVERAFHKQPA